LNNLEDEPPLVFGRLAVRGYHLLVAGLAWQPEETKLTGAAFFGR
jgi:hypothetical protein